jgi:hypothetical protein
VNDEDFARQFFARALDAASEPGALPDIDHITAAGRKAARNRQGLYAAGSVALVGAVTAGVVTASSLLDLGGNGTSTLTTTGSPSSSNALQILTKAPGVPCSQPPHIDWTALVTPHLPTGASLTPLHEPTCVQPAPGATAIEALYTLSHPDGTLQIDVETGLLATKSEQRDAARKAAEDAARKAAEARATTQAQLSSEGVTPAGKSAGAPQCSTVASGVTTCVVDVSEGGFQGNKVELFRTTAPQLGVTVIATAPKPTSAQPSPEAPIDKQHLIALAQAVAAHF